MSLISQHAILKKQQEKLDGAAAPPAVRALDSADKPKKKKKRARAQDAKDLDAEQEKEMKKLESFLFGALHAPPEFGNEGDAGDPTDAPLFFVDKSAGNDSEMVVYEEDLKLQQPGKDINSEKKPPAWVDEEEEEVEVDIIKVPRLRKLRKEAAESMISGADYVKRLRAQHTKLNNGTEWANLDRKSSRVANSDDESDYESTITVAPAYEDNDDILQGNEELVVKGSVKLLPGLLEYSRLMDANAEEPSGGPINSVQFHRNGQLLLAAGLDKRLRFFQVDGKRNTKIQSIFIEDCPIHKAAFVPDGSQVIVSGRRKFFYTFDVVKATVDKIGPLTGREEKSLEVFEVSPDSNTIAFIGNEGYILLISAKTKELIGTVKMNGTARSLAFADDGRQLLGSGGDGHIYHWDLRTRKCIHKAVDEGCLTGSALCASHDSALFAAGSSSGIVNVYNREEFLGGKRKPLKTIENLTTRVDYMKFNHDAQILAIASTMNKNGLKLVHLPSFNVFSNWPAPKFSLQYPRCLDFSPGGGFMAVGNAGGKVLLYKLHHYRNA